MPRHGANEVFLSNADQMVDDDDIDTLLSRGVEKTRELTRTIEKAIPTDEQYVCCLNLKQTFEFQNREYFDSLI